MDKAYCDYDIDPSTRNLVDEGIKNRNNGYHFVKTGSPAVYNSTMLIFLFRQFTELKSIPDNLFDKNLQTDLDLVAFCGFKPY